MSVARRKGNPGKADLLYSRLVRSRRICERCGRTDGPFDTAHIVKRRFSATRCVEENSWCLCRTCHQLTEQWPHEFMWLVERTIGVERYKELHALAQAGTKTNARLFWAAEVERLTARCKELGINTRWRSAS